MNMDQLVGLAPRLDRAPVWLAPSADAVCGELVRQRWSGPILRVLEIGELVGPAVLVLAQDDVQGRQRQALVNWAKRADPGRPVILGAYGHKEFVLDAINSWHVFRLVALDASPEAVLEALRGAHDALLLEQTVERLAEQLHEDCLSLQSTLDELKTTQRRLLHAERLAVVGRIVGTLMQQAQQHLTKLEQFKSAQLLSTSDPSLREFVDCISDGIDGFSTLLTDLLALTQHKSVNPHMAEEHLDVLVERSVQLFRHDPLGQQRELIHNCQSNAKVNIDRNRIHQVLLNLMRNAAQATQQGDRILVRTSIQDASCLIEVQDFGTGMTPDVLQRIFTPFFTTKGQAGMGIGLRMSRATVEAHGGTLDCTSTPGKGSCFRVRLPLSG